VKPSRAVACGTLVLMLLPSAGSHPQAYLKLGARAGDRNVALKWQRLPVRYFLTDRGVPGVTATQLQSAVTRSFGAWDQVSTAGTSSTFVGFTAANPFEDDAMSVIGFLNRPELERVLGATTFLIDTTDGEILEADIFLNSSFPWSVAQSGETGRFDVESIAVHEIGHLFGLGHSAIGETELRPTGGRRVIAAEAVMFPIAFAAGSVDGRTLKADDIAGVSDIYSTSEHRRRTGSISGRVTKNGKGVYGAHVVAMNVSTGTLVGNFSLAEDGAFVIASLDPGPHVLRAEPLDDAEIESFFQDTEKVDLDFRVTFFDQLVVVPSGGSTRQLEISVTPK
jgi:outer membrane protein assembly factor BamB